MLIVCAVPVLKLVLMAVLFKVTVAVIEPVADKRVVKAVNALGTAVGMFDDGTGISQFILLMLAMIVMMTDYSKKEVDNEAVISGKTNFYFEYFINGCHTFDAVSKIYEVRIVYLRTADCHGGIQPLAAVFSRRHFNR